LGAIYKIIYKILANRLKNILSKIIDNSQSTFLRDRGLVENIVVANEVVEELRKGNKPVVTIKVDYEKAYDFH